MTAEFAMAMPAVVLLLALCLSAVQLSARQLAMQDAAFDAARLIARGEAVGTAARHVAALVPGASLESDARDRLICVRVAAPGSGVLLGGVALAASACALDNGR